MNTAAALLVAAALAATVVAVAQPGSGMSMQRGRRPGPPAPNTPSSHMLWYPCNDAGNMILEGSWGVRMHQDSTYVSMHGTLISPLNNPQIEMSTIEASGQPRSLGSWALCDDMNGAQLQNAWQEPEPLAGCPLPAQERVALASLLPLAVPSAIMEKRQVTVRITGDHGETVTCFSFGD